MTVAQVIEVLKQVPQDYEFRIDTEGSAAYEDWLEFKEDSFKGLLDCYTQGKCFPNEKATYDNIKIVVLNLY